MDYSDLKNISGVELLENTPIDKYTTMRLSGTSTLAICKNVEALINLILQTKGRRYHLIGWGANQVIENKDSALLIKLDFEFDRAVFSEARSSYNLPASVPLNTLSSHAQKFGLKGWEVFTGVPASLGGAIYMNAGTALGEIGAIVEEVTILQKNGEMRTHKIDKDSFLIEKIILLLMVKLLFQLN